jgi:hypothetical protein
MSNRPYLLIAFLLLAILVGACNYPGYSRTPLQLSATSSPTAPLDPALEQIGVDPDCTSALIPGDWVGSVSSNTKASAMGFQVINQIAFIDLQLEISCTGNITGSARREGSGDIRVPFMLDGTCAENARYQVSGSVLSDDLGSPFLRLTFTTLEGALSCNLDSSISSIPSGEHSKDLAGTSFSVDMVPEVHSLTQISGSQWSDTLYQDQFSDTQEVMDEYDIVTKTTASWVLTLHK